MRKLLAIQTDFEQSTLTVDLGKATPTGAGVPK
jgi:hypothetical protein